MIRLFAILLAFLSWPASAETMVVRSGDHAGFSRLLLDGDIGLGWSIGRVEGGFEFRSEREDLSWELSRVYDRISRDRIRAVEDRGAGRLFVEVLCSCHADAFVLRDGQVVLDIKDGPSPGILAEFNAPFPQVPLSERSTQIQPRAGAPFLRDTIDERRGLPLLLPTGVTVPDETRRSDPSAQPQVQDQSVAPAAPRARVAETENALIKQIARAVAQGLIEADLSRVDLPARVPPPIEPEAPPRQDPVPVPVPTPAANPREHVSVETGVDRAAPTVEMQAATDDGDTCIDPLVFDIAAWGSSLEQGANIGSYRSKLLAEFDKANSTAITDLVHHYLYLTFGAEAKALLMQFPAAVDRSDLLIMMSEVMDGGQASTAAPLVPQMACDGATALWATFAQPGLKPGQPINADAVALAFAGLPAHLRRHLGPGLSEKFLQIDDTTTAGRIRNAIERAAPAHDPGLELTTARLDMARGDPERAAETLDAVVSQDSDFLPEALFERVEAALANGGAIAPDKIALLQSLAFEHQGTELGARLLEAEVEAQAMAGEFAAAFARLNDAKADPLVALNRRDVLASAVFSALSENAADTPFLTYAVANIETSLTLPAPARRVLAARFLALGLTEPARRVLGGRGALPDPEDRFLFAQAALAERRPEVAVGYLAGLKGENADLLRAEALEAAGDFAGAARMFEVAANPARATWSDWRGGIWDDLARREAGALSAAARLMVANNTTAPETEQTPDPQTQAAPLAHAQQLVDQSRADRAILDDLMEAIAPLPAPLG